MADAWWVMHGRRLLPAWERSRYSLSGWLAAVGTDAHPVDRHTQDTPSHESVQLQIRRLMLLLITITVVRREPAKSARGRWWCSVCLCLFRRRCCHFRLLSLNLAELLQVSQSAHSISRED